MDRDRDRCGSRCLAAAVQAGLVARVFVVNVPAGAGSRCGSCGTFRPDGSWRPSRDDGSAGPVGAWDWPADLSPDREPPTAGAIRGVPPSERDACVADRVRPWERGCRTRCSPSRSSARATSASATSQPSPLRRTERRLVLPHRSTYSRSAATGRWPQASRCCRSRSSCSCWRGASARSPTVSGRAVHGDRPRSSPPRTAAARKPWEPTLSTERMSCLGFVLLGIGTLDHGRAAERAAILNAAPSTHSGVASDQQRCRADRGADVRSPSSEQLVASWLLLTGRSTRWRAPTRQPPTVSPSRGRLRPHCRRACRRLYLRRAHTRSPDARARVAERLPPFDADRSTLALASGYSACSA